MEDKAVDLKIAIIDDSDYSRRATISILEDNGFNVVDEASDAVSAMTLIATSTANLFLIDVVMPELSGIEIAKKINENSIGGKYIVMMSSLNNENIIIESISHGAVDFLNKPFDEDDLISSVLKVKHMMKNN